MSDFYVITLRDIKANVYLPPMFVPNIFAAQRDLADMVNGQKDHNSPPWVKHPEDFELWLSNEWSSEDDAYSYGNDPNFVRRRLLLVSELVQASH